MNDQFSTDLAPRWFELGKVKKTSVAFDERGIKVKSSHVVIVDVGIDHEIASQRTSEVT